MITTRTAQRLSQISRRYHVRTAYDRHTRTAWYSVGNIRDGRWHQSMGSRDAAAVEDWLLMMGDNHGDTLITPIGRRERMSCGEVTVPTYYGSLRRGDRAELVRRGYPASKVRLASGIRSDGSLVIWVGAYYYEVPAN